MKGDPGSASSSWASSSAPEVIRQGELEKRSDGLFQLWKKKRVVLSKDRLRLVSPEAGGGVGVGGAGKGGRAKELPLGSIQKVDCVERTGKYVYFTLVTTDRKEIDFRCPGESCWNASIALALIDFQNQRALEDFKRSRRREEEEEEEEEEAAAARDRRLARAP
ncbi:hypothetical protein JRQ81_000332 [Phrynocephalus forsythii]|uniref:Pleckstrin homology-like domain family A member 2 n=1 Tax=Phrynocephalus forsythii TaxID=171643 RepID=A0A9Q0Y690_9SAUR|nr:hypothetical protein JRQ81_000332 [Phrynocephalus forsythii]